MFTLNVGFLGCNGERGKEKSKVNFNFPVLQIYGRFIFSFYSDAGFCAIRPVRLDRSAKAFLHWPAELLAGSSDTTGRAFRKSKTTLARAPMVPEHEHLRLTLSLNCRLVLIWERSFFLEIIRRVRLSIAANFHLYFLCRLTLPWDEGGKSDCCHCFNWKSHIFSKICK